MFTAPDLTDEDRADMTYCSRCCEIVGDYNAICETCHVGKCELCNRRIMTDGESPDGGDLEAEGRKDEDGIWLCVWCDKAEVI